MKPVTENVLAGTWRHKLLPTSINQSINQYIYNAPWYRGVCYSADYAEAKRNVLSRVLNVLIDGAVDKDLWLASYTYNSLDIDNINI